VEVCQYPRFLEIFNYFLHYTRGGRKMKATVMIVSMALLLVMLAGCAPGPNELINSPAGKIGAAGFWHGLWHGIIAPVTFIVSLFDKSVQMYEVHNTGSWYNLGFLLGMSIVFGGGAGGASARRSRR
jgi:hypothetical protein